MALHRPPGHAVLVEAPIAPGSDLLQRGLSANQAGRVWVEPAGWLQGRPWCAPGCCGAAEGSCYAVLAVIAGTLGFGVPVTGSLAIDYESAAVISRRPRHGRAAGPRGGPVRAGVGVGVRLGGAYSLREHPWSTCRRAATRDVGPWLDMVSPVLFTL